jgi:hypothetical protein
MRYSEFVFDNYRYDPAGNSLSLRYRFAGGPGFEEKLSFDFVPRALSEDEERVLDRMFRLIFLFAGVSYYKAFIPERLVCTAFPVDPETAEFVTRFYRKGLGEFAWRNRVSLDLRFDPDRIAAPAPLRLDLPRLTCVPVGGGKDSVVTLECLKRAGEPVVLFSLGEAAPIADCIAVSGLPSFRVYRRLDPALFALNRAGALNGHVPITGILSAIALAAAVLFGFDAVAMSNEHSASAPNLVSNGVAVNHQFSKSLEFERDLSEYVARHISPNIRYFSLLRPLSEIEIARRFAGRPEYFTSFLSCNTAFRQSPAERGRQWCGACPKCRFVFLALAPFAGKPELTRIFRRNLLDDDDQTSGFAALCGLSEHKPFECVGETSESAATMAYLGREPAWRDAVVVRRLHQAYPVLRRSTPEDFAALLASRHPHRVPARYQAMLDAGG